MTQMYNWNDLPREIVRKGIERCGFRGEEVIVVMNWVAPSITVNPHRHTFEQLEAPGRITGWWRAGAAGARACRR